MADVRKLLQAERRLREIAKPAAPPSPRVSTKRSLPEIDEATATKRQKTSTNPITTRLPAGFFDDGGKEGAGAGAGATIDEVLETSNGDGDRSPQGDDRGDVGAEKDDASMAGAPDANANSTTLPSDFFEAKSSVPSSARIEVNEDEWAAFQVEVAEPARQVTTSAAIIEAAPTTNNPAATSDEEDVVDAYAKGEEEDAKQKLLDEFEEMEGLEQRVLRLKERREALKNKAPVITKMEVAEVELDDQNSGEGEDEDEEDDDDFFRARGP